MKRYTWTLYLIEVFRKCRRFEGDGNTPEPPAEEPALRDLQGEVKELSCLPRGG